MLKYNLIRQVSDTDFDNLVMKTYGKSYAIQQHEGCRDRGVIYISVPSLYDINVNEYPDTIEQAIDEDMYGVRWKDWLAVDPNDERLGEDEWDRELNLQRNVYPPMHDLINDLYEKGLIEAGEYQIEIDW